MKNLATELNDIFRANVLGLIAEYGWNQSELAAEMGVTKSYVSQVLSGHRGAGLDTVSKFAKALQVEPASLISEKTKVAG